MTKFNLNLEGINKKGNKLNKIDHIPDIDSNSSYMKKK